MTLNPGKRGIDSRTGPLRTFYRGPGGGTGSQCSLEVKSRKRPARSRIKSPFRVCPTVLPKVSPAFVAPSVDSTWSRLDDNPRFANSSVFLLCGLTSSFEECLKSLEFPPCPEICLIHFGHKRRKLVPPHQGNRRSAK